MSDLRIIEPGRQWAVGLEGIYTPLGAPGADADQIIPGLWSRVGAGDAAPGDDHGWGYCRRLSPEDPADRRWIYVAGALRPAPADDLPGGWVCREIGATRFAVFEHRGPLAGFPQTIREAVRAVARDPHWQPVGHDLERYGPDFHPTSETSRIGYWVGVTPRHP